MCKQCSLPLPPPRRVYEIIRDDNGEYIVFDTLARWVMGRFMGVDDAKRAVLRYESVNNRRKVAGSLL